MKEKILAAFMTTIILISSTMGPVLASMPPSKDEHDYENSYLNSIEDKNNKDKPIIYDELDIDNKPMEEFDEESDINSDILMDSSEGEDQNDELEEEVDQKVDIIEKTEVAKLYQDSSYFEESKVYLDIRITGQMPENAIIKAYEIENLKDIEGEDIILSFAFEIFDGENQVYEKNPQDTYKISLRSSDFDHGNIKVYEKNSTDISFTKVEDFEKNLDEVKLVSSKNVFIISKEKKEKADLEARELFDNKNIKENDNRNIEEKLSNTGTYKESLEKLKKKDNSEDAQSISPEDIKNLRENFLDAIRRKEELDDNIKEQNPLIKDKKESLDSIGIEKEKDFIKDKKRLNHQQILADIYLDASYKQRANDSTKIKLNGLLPVGAKVKAYPVEIKIEGQEVLAAYDITIFDRDNNEYKVGAVNEINVKITNKKIKKAKKVEVYHKKNEFAPEERIDNKTKTDDTVAFKADSFSIYAITEAEAKATRTYEFWVLDINSNKEKLVNKQTIRSGQSLTSPPIPILDSGEKFEGWYHLDIDKYGSEMVEFSKPIYFDSDTPETIELVPVFTNQAYIDFRQRVYISKENKGDYTIPSDYKLSTDGFYRNSQGEKLYRDEVLKTHMQEFDKTIGQATVPILKNEEGSIFAYWSLDPYGKKPFDIENTPITRELIIKQGEKSGISQKVKLDLFANFKSGYTISFDSDGGSHVTKILVNQGEKIDPNKVIDPLKPGYRFKGWSLSRGGEIVRVSDIDVNKSMTLFAIYEKLPGTYTVSHYTENIYDNNFTFYKSESFVASVGSNTPDGEYFRDKTHSEVAKDLVSKGYTKPKSTSPSDKSKPVKGDGSTNINVYYRRPRYKINIYTTGILQGVPSLRFSDELKEDEDTAEVWKRAEKLVNRYEVREGDLKGPILKTPPKMPAKELNLIFVPTLGNEDWFVNYIEVDENDKPILDAYGNPKVLRKEAHNAIIAGVATYKGGGDLEGFTYRYVTEPGIDKDSPKVYTIGEAKEVRTYYRRNNYKLTFKTNNNNFKDKLLSIAYETNINSYVPTDIKIGMVDKEGSVFKGWYDNPEFTGVPLDFSNLTMPAKDITIHGKWEAEEYNVRIYKEMTTPGQISSPEKMEEFLVKKYDKLSKDDKRLNAIKPEKIKDKADTRLVWYRFSNGQFEPYDFNELITTHLFLYPVWQYLDPVTNTYKTLEDVNTITYTDGQKLFIDKNLYLNNAAAILQGPYTLEDGSKLDNPNGIKGNIFQDFIIPEGKHFQGWLLDNNPGRVYLPGELINVNKDLKFYPKWGEYKNTSIILYNMMPNTDKNDFSRRQIPENGIITLPDLKKDGWSFLGWSKTKDGLVQFKGDDQIMVTREGMPNVLYGIWEKPSTLTIDFKRQNPSIAQNIKIYLSYQKKDGPHREEFVINNGETISIEVPTQATNIILSTDSYDIVRYEYNNEIVEGKNLEIGKINGNANVSIKTWQLPPPTGLIDNIAPMAIMLALAIMAFSYRFYKKDKLAGGIDE